MMQRVQAVAGLSDCTLELGGFELHGDSIVRFELPSTFTKEDLARAQKDFESIASLFKSHPDEMMAIFNSAVQNKPAEAAQIARKIGLGEEPFTAQGGGLVWLLIGAAIVAGVLLWPSSAY